MRIAVIGGSGHVGTFLVPRLVRAGHEVLSLSRGTSKAYADSPEWERVETVKVDRQAEDADGTFGIRVRDLNADVVIDMVCFTLTSAHQIVDALRGTETHLIHCGSIWRYGPTLKVPIQESQGSAPFGEYGVEKERIAQMLKAETAQGGLDTTSIHPGHIVGPGWEPTGLLGNTNPDVWRALSAGEPIQVPGSGTETLHHVHADDVAQVFQLAVEHRDAARGEDFHAVGPSALSVRGYAETGASWFGQTPALEYVSWEEYRASTTEHYAVESWGHLHRSHVVSTAKARDLLGYGPKWEPEDAIFESVKWLIDNDRLKVSQPLSQ